MSTIRETVRLALRRVAHAANLAGYAAKRRAPADKEFAAVVEKLTNWQRNQWARAGYPGLRPHDPAQVRPFLLLRHGAGGERRAA
jgi:hypothetical protein